MITGIVYIKVEGDLVYNKEGASLDLGGYSKTAQTGWKLYGFSRKFMPSVVKFTLAHRGGDDLQGLAAKEGIEINFETDTGDVYLIANAECTTPLVLTAGEGDVEVEFQGDPARLI